MHNLSTEEPRNPGPAPRAVLSSRRIFLQPTATALSWQSRAMFSLLADGPVSEPRLRSAHVDLLAPGTQWVLDLPRHTLTSQLSPESHSEDKWQGF